MKFGFAQTFTEPSITLNVSHKVNSLLNERLNEALLEKYNLIKVEEDWIVNFKVTTNSEVKEVAMSSMIEYEEDKWREFIIYIPQSINSSEDINAEYVQTIFACLKDVLIKDFNILESDIASIQNDCLNQIKENSSSYLYEDTWTKPLSPEELKELGID